MERRKYPRAVEEAINKVCLLASNDSEAEEIPALNPLDGVDFNPVDYINERFPDEGSLSSLDSFISSLKTRANEAEANMYEAVRSQATSSALAVRNISESRDSIKQLSSKIKEIKGKAAQSEIMVQEICRDIKRLDYAKKNLTLTITSLKRFHMLIKGVDKLEFMVHKRQYREAANLLQAVAELVEHFKNHEAVPKIKELCNTVEQMKDLLSKQIFEDFESLSEISADFYRGSEEENIQYYSASTQTPESLAGACCVVDALGSDTRRMLISTLCKGWLKPYERIFGTGSSDATLEFTKRRYAWFQRALGDNEERFLPIFPNSWQIFGHFAVLFCEYTRKHLKAELGKFDPPESVPVGELVRALRCTLDFEEAMTLRYEEAQGGTKPEEQNLRSTGELSQPSPGTEAKESESKYLVAPFSRSISFVFEPYLVAYVKRESESIRDQLQKVLREEEVDKNGPMPLLSSAVNLFLYIKNSISRCTKFTTGQAFYDLYKEHKACLVQYSNDLNAKVNSTVSSKKGFDVETATTLCFVLNSAEYCADTVSQLEDMVKSKIDTAFVDAVDMEKEQDLFYGNITNSLTSLVNGVESILLPGLQDMTKRNWSALEHVGDQSRHINVISSTISEFVPSTKGLLSEVYFKTFCDKLAFAFLPKYFHSITQCKLIGDYGSQQLLLDTHALKTIFLQIPSDDSTMETFSKFVTSEMEKCEVLLKLVGMPIGTADHLLLENFTLLWPHGAIQDFQTVLDLRGRPRNKQVKILKEAAANGIAEREAKPERISIASPEGTSPAINMSKFDILNAVKGFSADMSSAFESNVNNLQSSYKRAVNKN